MHFMLALKSLRSEANPSVALARLRSVSRCPCSRVISSMAPAIRAPVGDTASIGVSNTARPRGSIG
jgi:hypothetical protein